MSPLFNNKHNDFQENSNTNFDKENIKENTKKFMDDFKKLKKVFFTLMPIIILLVIAQSFFFTVYEDEVAIVRQFGKITKIIVDKDNVLVENQNQLQEDFSDVEIVKGKGIFFKTPFITKVDWETSKLLTYQSQSENINTRDKRQYQVSMFAQWEITHPGLFQMKMGSVNKANTILDDLVYPIIIKRINKLDSEVFLIDKETLYETLEQGLEQINEVVAENGIVVKDIEINRTLLPATNIESTYRKMVAEREAIAQQIRSEGQELYQKTVADTDREVAQIMAQSIEESEKIRGEADAAALEIYANGFSRDPEFYEFWKSMNSYENAIDKDTVIFMDKNNRFLKYFSGQ